MGGRESTQNSRNKTPAVFAIAITAAIGATCLLFRRFGSDDGVTNSDARDIINEREKFKETKEYIQTIEEEEEWTFRQRQLQIQAEEAQRRHEQEKAERRRLSDLQTRQKERIEEVRKKKEKGFLQSHTLVEATVKPPTSLPEGVKFELHTLPVVPKAVVDGDGVTVYVSTSDPRESSFVPSHVHITAVERSEARARRNYAEADALHRQIIDSGYRLIKLQNEEVLARKYRIRLRGIDAPESSMPYGKEAKDELTKIVQGESLRVLVYGEDHYGRHVGDIYCNGVFVQELMLKKGLAWHYAAYDNRVQLERWEKEARAKGVGLWASSNPEKPWEWRKNQREGSKRRKIVEAPGRNHRIFRDDFEDDPSANFEGDFEDDPSTNFEGDFEDDSTGYLEFEVDLEFDYM